MNEFLRNFIMKTIRGMIDSASVPEWQVREYAIGWYSKGVLNEEDLQEIEERYKKIEPTEESITEEQEEVVAENEQSTEEEAE